MNKINKLTFNTGHQGNILLFVNEEKNRKAQFLNTLLKGFIKYYFAASNYNFLLKKFHLQTLMENKSGISLKAIENCLIQFEVVHCFKKLLT